MDPSRNQHAASFEADDNVSKYYNHQYQRGSSDEWHTSSLSLGGGGGSSSFFSGNDGNNHSSRTTGASGTRADHTVLLLETNTMHLNVNQNTGNANDGPESPLVHEVGNEEELNQKPPAPSSSSPSLSADEDVDAWKELPLWVQELSELRASLERASVHNAILLDKLYRCGAVNRLDDFY